MKKMKKKKKTAGKIRACARDHFHDFRTGYVPVTSLTVAHVHAIISGSTTTSHHHLKYDLSCTHILLMHIFVTL
jgi:hypothetical protein